MGRKELQQQAVLGVEKVLRRQPTNWRHNLAPYILLVERTNKLLAELTVAEMREAFPASEHADDQALNESAWQRKADMEKTLGSIGPAPFSGCTASMTASTSTQRTTVPCMPSCARAISWSACARGRCGR